MTQQVCVTTDLLVVATWRLNMLKIFLVEDEIIMREGIKKNINWEKENFEFVGDAGDGELAYPLIIQKKPDILITDIKMPFMDGLELSRLVKAELPDIKIIVLSGYDEFDYAKEAIDIGIAEYMLKPVTSAKLIEALHKIEKIILAQRERISVKSGADEKMKFFRKLVSGRMGVSLLLKEGRQLGIELAASEYNLLLLQLFAGTDVDESHSRLEKIRQGFQRLKGSYPGIEIADQGREEFWFLLKGTENQPLSVLERDIETELVTLIGIEQQTEYFGILGKRVERLGDLKTCYEAANNEFAHRFLKERNRIYDIAETTDTILDIESLNVSQTDRKSLEQFLNTGLKSDIDDFIDTYFDKVGNKNLQSMLFRQYVVMDVYIIVISASQKMGYTKQELVEFYGDEQGLMKVFGSVEDTKDYLKKLLETTIELREKAALGKYDKVLKQAQEYIEANYNQYDISLNTVAANVNLSPNHFSAIFSQELGETFIEYLTRVRMEKAKELLRTTSKKSMEIAYEVGYKDAHYFSNLFKKTQNCTPREYRMR